MSGLYRSGFEAWGDWLTGPRQWLLFRDGYVPHPGALTVANVAPWEVTVSGYARKAVTGAVEAETSYQKPGRAYGAQPAAWTGLSAGQQIVALVLAYSSGSDSADGLIAWWDIYIASDVADLTVSLSPWQERDGTALPGGDDDTRLVHLFESAGTL
jgi:hypothetical protein